VDAALVDDCSTLSTLGALTATLLPAALVLRLGLSVKTCGLLFVLESLYLLQAVDLQHVTSLYLELMDLVDEALSSYLVGERWAELHWELCDSVRALLHLSAGFIETRDFKLPGDD
jgi:hypothetical protein